MLAEECCKGIYYYMKKYLPVFTTGSEIMPLAKQIIDYK